MKLDKIGDLLTISANIGIVVGLILVYLQMSQNEQLVRLDLSARAKEFQLQYQLQMMGDNAAEAWGKAGLDPSKLTAGEAVQIDHMLSFYTTLRDYHEWLTQNGMRTEEEWDRYSKVYYALQAQFLFGANPVARRWWNLQIGSSDLSPESWQFSAQRGVDRASGTETDFFHRYLKGAAELPQ